MTTRPGPVDPRVHRPPWAPLAGGAAVLLAAVLLVDLLVRGDGREVAAGVLLLAGVVVLAWVLGLQPRLVEHVDGVEVVNRLRRARLRWSQVREVVPGDVLVLVTDDGEVRCTAVVGRGRAAAAGRAATRRAYPGTREADLGESDAGADGPAAVAARLEARVAQARRGRAAPDADPSGAARLRWHVPSVLLTVLGAVLVVAALLV